MNTDKNELRKLAEAQKLFTDWRLSRNGREAIPEGLWEKAFALLSQFTVTKVARALRLNGPELKRRAIQAGFICEQEKVGKKKGASKPKVKETTFVEMVVPDGMGEALTLEDNPTTGWRIHMTRKDGTQLEITPPSFSDVRMQGLVRGFLRG